MFGADLRLVMTGLIVRFSVRLVVVVVSVPVMPRCFGSGRLIVVVVLGRIRAKCEWLLLSIRLCVAMLGRFVRLNLRWWCVLRCLWNSGVKVLLVPIMLTFLGDSVLQTLVPAWVTVLSEFTCLRRVGLMPAIMLMLGWVTVVRQVTLLGRL